ncbi:MAG TPA: hypothetical protein VKA76_03505 [Gammaproteobacteria bacterium]|nr:hypothetical protein [Gammaproteobacteria bacterium]
MSLLELSIPECTTQPAGNGLDARALERWLAELPLGDPQEAARALSGGLAQHNRTAWPAAARLAAAEHLRPIGEETGAALRSRLRSASLPLSARARQVAELGGGLLRELTDSYKIALLELADTKAADTSLRLLALYRSVELLARQVVDTYLVYGPEPHQAWGELHRLYRYAELMGIQAQPLAESGRASVEHAYKRVVLLALVDPYQLMQQEANNVYKWLDQWADRCPMEAADALSAVAGRFYVDLDSESPPRYAPRDLDRRPSNPRILECGPLAQAATARLSAIAKEATDEDGRPRQLPLARRMERDLLQRLRDGWNGPRDRASARHSAHANVEIAAGLSACHHFLSAEAPFTPEKDEITLHRAAFGSGGGSAAKPSSKLSLVPAESEPWKADEDASQLEQEINMPRRSVFDSASDDLDMWQKVYATRGRGEDDDEGAGPAYRATPWQQKNASDQGLCLYCRSDCPVQLRVGELVVFQISGDPGRWQVGAVRWLCAAPGLQMEMGIEVLADSATPLAIRGVQGVGKDSEYFRALRLPAGDLKDPAGTLVVPASIYDSGTVTALHGGDALLYARLTTLVETTRSYSRFQYELVSPPDSEQRKLESLRQLL